MSYISSSKQIDRVWMSNRVIPSSVVVFPHRFRVGNHRVILVDFNWNDIIGRRINIYKLNMRRLIFKKALIIKKYNQRAVELLREYEISERLN